MIGLYFKMFSCDHLTVLSLSLLLVLNTLLNSYHQEHGLADFFVKDQIADISPYDHIYRSLSYSTICLPFFF